MGGVIALKKRECHAAPMHLLAPDGTYNTHYLRRYALTPTSCSSALRNASRASSPARVWGSTTLPGRRFVNRQKGSGTRVLLDYRLAERGIDPASIPATTARLRRTLRWRGL